MQLTANIAPGVYPAGRLDRIPLGEGRRVTIGDGEIAVFRTREGGVYGVQAHCPHLGGPLADGIVGSGKVSCPLHGYAFELATGEPVKNSCSALQTFSVEVTEKGDILVRVGAEG